MKNIVLIGFMGTGKTTVGRILAERTGREFVDCDRMIESEEKRSINQIFAAFGEDYFRRKESEVIARLAMGEDKVIATGGGAVMNPQNFAALRANGVTIGLTASAETLGRRLERSEDRPLIAVADRQSVIEKLLEERLPVYRQADIVVQTDDFDSPTAVAEEVLRQLNLEENNGNKHKLRVELGERSYDILIGPGELSTLGERLRDLPINDSLMVVTNPKVGGLYLETVEKTLKNSGWHYRVVVIPDGETYKSLEEAEKLYDAAIETGLERKSAVIALGGGVIGDLSGFVAATYQRGVNFVQIPTTLLAQVDSAVGGKVAVNHPMGKNLIGSFYQPRLVIADIDVLQTLDDRDYASGMAEVVKSAYIRDASLFEFLEREVDAVNGRDPKIMSEVVASVCRIKADVVATDEQEAGIRAILNFGHTVGHAVEAVTGYLEYRHGEAIAMGMAAAAEIAVRMGLCPREAVERLIELLVRFRLPVRLPSLPASRLMEALKKDKKADRGHVGFVLPTSIGAVLWGRPVEEPILRETLLDLGAGKE